MQSLCKPILPKLFMLLTAREYFSSTCTTLPHQRALPYPGSVDRGTRSLLQSYTTWQRWSPSMATAAADPAGADSLRKGDEVQEQKAQEPAPGSIVQETEPVRPLNGTSFSTTRSSGPPILHPTDTTWQWLFASTDMVHTPTVVHSGLTVEQERYSRWKGVQLIFRIGDYMRL